MSLEAVAKPTDSQPDSDALVALGDLPEGTAFETPHTGRLGVVLEHYERGTLVELDDLLYGGFEEKCLAKDTKVYRREAQS